MRLASRHDTEMTTAPVRITRRAPTRSTNVPTTGDRTPCTTDDSEKAPAARPRDQRNSSSSGTRKTENENMRPNAMPSVSQTATMRSHGEVEAGAVGAVTLPGRIRRLCGARLTVRGRRADDPAMTPLERAEAAEHALSEERERRD